VRVTAFGMEKTVRILLADDDHQVLSALRLVLEQEPAWLVTNEFHGLVEMLHYFENAIQCEETTNGHDNGQALVLLIDWELPGFQPKEHIKEIHRLCQQIKIIGLSVMMAAHPEILASQVDAFVSKSDTPDHVIAALQDLILKFPPTK
jgi:DNA-binding NarL/FixJ family response regulator